MQIFRLKSQRILLLFLLLGTLLVPASIITNNASAQEAIQWYPAKRIPNYDDQYNPPILVADQNQTIHAFNSEPINETENAIFYRKFTRDQGWGIPVSIIYPVNRQANIVQGAFLDPLGSIHLVYYHGVVPDAAIYYARSPLSAAGKVAEWSQPEALGRDAGPVVAASIIGDKDGKLVMVYFGQGEGPGLYQVHSENEGETWSEPQLIYEVIKPNISPINIQTDIDANGNVHVVWANINELGWGDEVYYLQIRAGFQEWSKPVLLAAREDDDYSTRWPSIKVYKDELIVVYQDDFPAARWTRRSLDWGASWTLPQRVSSHVGEYGYGALQIDSKGFLHMIMGNRTTTTEPALHGMWHTVWLNNRWSELIPIVLGPKTDPFDPTEPVAVISQGNFILATWRNDATPEHRTGPWFSFSLLDAPEAPINPLPTIVPPPLETQSEAQIDPTPVITNTPSPSLSGTNDDLGTRVDPRITAQPLFLGIVPVILLILAIFVGKRKSR